MKTFKHNLSKYWLLTGNMGRLYPCGLTEVLPGDTFDHGSNMLLRLAPMIAPLMHPVTVRLHHWFVPHRLTWDGFEDFITGGPDGNDVSTVPTVDAEHPGSGPPLLDYFGIESTPGLSVSALPLRAYNLIWNEYYRDQDLQTEVDQDNDVCKTIAWEKDYFTTARPWPQRGDAVSIPLGTDAPLSGIGVSNQTYGLTSQAAYETDGTGTTTYANARNIGDLDANMGALIEEDPNNSGFPNMRVDLSNATAASIDQLRQAFALQRFAEARARYGARYTEYLRYLGIRPDDARLDLPEYLGGGRVQVSISEVLQTAPETLGGTEYGVGDMYGHGIAALRSNRYRRFFREHGYVVSVVSVRPKTIYMQGIDRTFLRQDKEDFFQKELQFIGQQEVWNAEVYAGAATPRGTFGWQDRYREYREGTSKVCGEFRDTLDFWHLGRDFESEPALNTTFVSCNPSKRVFSVETNHVLWMAVQHRLVARRMVSRSSAGRII